MNLLISSKQSNGPSVKWEPIEVIQAHSRAVARAAGTPKIQNRYTKYNRSYRSGYLNERDYLSPRYLEHNPSIRSQSEIRSTRRRLLSSSSPDDQSGPRIPGLPEDNPEGNCWRKSIRPNGSVQRHRSGRRHDRRSSKREGWLGETDASIAGERRVSSRGTGPPLPRGSLATASGSAATAGCRWMTSCYCDRRTDPGRWPAISTSRSRHPATTSNNIAVVRYHSIPSREWRVTLKLDI